MFGIDDAALAILAAGLASSAGSLYANHQNVKSNRFINDVNYAIAEANNAAQIQLANTAHQREVFDLRAAGLNPILSAGGSGASTPSLTSARGTPSQIDNPVNDLASSAQSLGRYLSQQYKTDLDQQQADLRATQLGNDISELEAAKADVELQALSELTTGHEYRFDPKTGRYHTYIVPNSSESPYFKALKRGILSQAEVGQVMPYIDAGSRVINSAAGLRGLIGTGRRRK